MQSGTNNGVGSNVTHNATNGDEIADDLFDDEEYDDNDEEEASKNGNNNNINDDDGGRPDGDADDHTIGSVADFGTGAPNNNRDSTDQTNKQTNPASGYTSVPLNLDPNFKAVSLSCMAEKDFTDRDNCKTCKAIRLLCMDDRNRFNALVEKVFNSTCPKAICQNIAFFFNRLAIMPKGTEPIHITVNEIHQHIVDHVSHPCIHSYKELSHLGVALDVLDGLMVYKNKTTGDMAMDYRALAMYLKVCDKRAKANSTFYEDLAKHGAPKLPTAGIKKKTRKK